MTDKEILQQMQSEMINGLTEEETNETMSVKGLTKPKKEWVGLTDEEREEIALELPIDAVHITEAKLKEKNT